MDKQCKTCKWWDLIVGKEVTGMCHYNPPTVVVVRSGFDASLQPTTVFPETASTDFCALWTTKMEGVEMKSKEPGSLAT